jgi:hypothetical protein
LLLRHVEACAAAIPEMAEPEAAAVPGADVGSTRPAAIKSGVFRRDDRGWTLALDGTTVRVKDAKGVQFMARLLRHPEQEIHALDLVAAANESTGGGTTAAALGAALGDAGELLDRKARDAYKQRLDDLRERLVAAKQVGAVETATRLENEVDFLTHELSRAVGLGNRERRAGSAAERARLNVTRAIKAAEDAIAALHPALGAYLRVTIRTGTFCLYRPAAEAPVVWSF